MTASRITLEGERPPRDPSLGLLDRLVQDALDQGYVNAAARRSTDGGPGRAGHGVGGRLGVVVGLALVGVVLALAATQQWAAAPDAAQRKQELGAAVETADARVRDVQARLEIATADVDRLRDEALQSDGAGRLAQAELLALGEQAGTVAVRGPGVIVTIDDAPVDQEAQAAGAPDLGRVLDRDLQILVNGLWQAGAEAVDINGERLTSLSAIRGAGAAVLVNYRPLVRPYVVSAIGDPATLVADVLLRSVGRRA